MSVEPSLSPRPLETRPTPQNDQAHVVPTVAKRGKFNSKATIILRRVHLYAGLFLLPWVFLFGVTGPMFTHRGLFPESIRSEIATATLQNTPISQFPSAESLAKEIVIAMNQKLGRNSIELSPTHGSAFTNSLQFEIKQEGTQAIVEIDPIRKTASIFERPEASPPKRLVNEFHQVSLPSQPIELARQTADRGLREAGFEYQGEPRTLGWTKVNFVALVDGEPARVTYVLNDGHVDVVSYTGDHDMNLRQFLMRLHTSHGLTPHWNARFFWIVVSDALGVAMVTWALTGLIMWWQIKRTRRLGFVVILLSLITASTLFIGMQNYYATTVL